MKTFILLDQDRLKNLFVYLKKIPLDGTFQVKIEKKPRTLKQNSILWGVAYPAIMKEIGMVGKEEAEELHKMFCGSYFGWKVIDLMGTDKQIPVRTTTINHEGKKEVIPMNEMRDFYQFIQIKSAEYGVMVPDPDPYFNLKGKENENGNS